LTDELNEVVMLIGWLHWNLFNAVSSA